MRYRALVWSLVLAAAACGREAEGPADPSLRGASGAGVAEPVRVASLTLFEPPPFAMVGQVVQVGATVIGENGMALTDRVVSWSNDNPAVARLLRVTGADANNRALVTLLSGGRATITATVEGHSATLALLATAGGPTPPGLRVEDASMIEFEYPTQPGHWHYAPQLRLAPPAGAGGVSVVGARFDIPGITPGSPCSTQRFIPAGQTVDVFQETYGDYEFSIDQRPNRATGQHATGVFFVADASGLVGSVTVTMPVVSGALPLTYSGRSGASAWRCF